MRRRLGSGIVDIGGEEIGAFVWIESSNPVLVHQFFYES
jgi:hypothetical protein